MTAQTWPPSTTEDGTAACLTIPLDIVDAAFERPGGEAGDWMKTHLCRVCPIAEQCLAFAMDHFEPGVWGGTSPHSRTRSGAPGRPDSPGRFRGRDS